MDNEEIPEEPPTLLVQNKGYQFEGIIKSGVHKPRAKLLRLQSRSQK
jgi:hypothetical protein